MLFGIMPDKSGNFPHDAAYKRLFHNPEIVKSLLTQFVPEDFIRDFNWDTLRPCDTSYTSKHFQKRFSDVVWAINWKDTECYICILLEFQSAPTNWMALRMLTYVGLFLENLLERNEGAKLKKLPPVFPIVVYNGERPWTAALNIRELIEPLHPALTEFQPIQKYCLVDEKRIPPEILKNAKGVAAYLVRTEQARSANDIYDVAMNFNEEAGVTNEQMREDVLRWMDLKISAVDPAGYEKIKNAHGLEDSEMLLELMDRHNKILEHRRQQYRDEGFSEGISKGKAEGLAEGEARGIAAQRRTLLAMLEDRFGDIPASWKTAISEITDDQILSQLTRAILKVNSAGEYGEKFINREAK